LAETNATLEKRANEFGAERDALSADMEALEGRLRERGQRIATLEAELREGLRVGKELLTDLEEARAIGSEANPSNGNGSGSLGGTGDKTVPPVRGSSPTGVASAAAELPNAITVQLDGLAARAARAEADLEAARWRISQLEHAGIAFDREDIEPAAIAVELEQALLASQQELATLRRMMGPEGGHVAASVVEQAVLLQQVANQMGGAAV
jgi:DNA repair exonuclease SbcCD ATPase subunit